MLILKYRVIDTSKDFFVLKAKSASKKAEKTAGEVIAIDKFRKKLK